MPSVPLSSAWEHRADRTAHLIEDFFERFHQTLAFVFEGRGEADREAPSPLRSLATRQNRPILSANYVLTSTANDTCRSRVLGRTY